MQVGLARSKWAVRNRISILRRGSFNGETVRKREKGTENGKIEKSGAHGDRKEGFE